MKRNIILPVVALIFSSFMACSDFEEINRNPNNPSTVPVHLLLPPVIQASVATMTGSGNGAAGQWIQHLNYTGGNSEGYGRYNITGASFREQWNGQMRIIKDINQIIKIGGQTKKPQYVALGLIWKVYTLELMCDAYGDIPYTEAGRGDETGLEFPHYQEQSEVYSLMLADLEEANVILEGLSEDVTIENDILYQGDATKWRKFANSLKLRLLMRQSAKIDVKQQVAGIFGNPEKYPFFTSAADQATLVYNNTVDYYTWYMKNKPSDNSGVDFGDNYRVSEAVVDMLKSTQDPRLTVFAAPTEKSFKAHRADPSVPLEYIGQPAGLSAAEQVNLDVKNTSVLSSTIRDEKRAFLMSYTELSLIKTEAILRGMISGDAAAEYQKAVKASFAKWNDITDADISDYFTNPANHLTTDVTESMRQVGEQLWMDNFLNGYEAFANWRRLGIPSLKVGPSVLSKIPVRYIYSDNEQNNPNLVIWAEQKLGRMFNETDLVWFQPQVWDTPQGALPAAH